jgi:hypothetical protein
MKEKELIVGEKCNIKMISTIIAIVGIIATLVVDYISIPGIIEDYGILGVFFGDEGLFFTAIIFGPILVIALVLYFSSSKVCLTVTDKRVYGTAIFGKRVDLPLDMISAISTSFLKGIGVSTSSGVIKFWLIKNNEEIHKTISELLLKRQDKKVETVKEEVKTSDADELKKYKELLDDGAITQEEYDAKKKEILKL